jgi:large subunit ribosomal protein L18Ae
MGYLKEFLVVGRALPTERDQNPKVYRMRLFAKSDLVAKSRFWYFMRRLTNLKKMNGEILAVSQIFETKPLVIKNFGIWLRYDSRSGTHNMYKEYRELSRSDAVSACYQDMAARHRARFRSIHIIKIAEMKGKSNVRRPSTKAFMTSSIKFPLPHRRMRAPSKRFARTFTAKRPNTHFG